MTTRPLCRILSLILCALLLLPLFAACSESGGNSDNPSSSSGNDPGTPAAETRKWK